MANWCVSVGILNTTFSLITSISNNNGLENSLGYIFGLKKTKNDIKFALKSTDFEL